MAIINGDKENAEESALKKPILKKNVHEKLKKLFVGWKHRSNEFSNYNQIKEPTGGIRFVELNSEKSYSFQEIKDACTAIMINDENKTYFTNSCIELGNFHHEIFHDFIDMDGTRCDFWNFSYRIRTKNRMLKIYLLTTKKSLVPDIQGNCEDNFTISDYPDIAASAFKQKNALTESTISNEIYIQKSSRKHKQLFEKSESNVYNENNNLKLNSNKLYVKSQKNTTNFSIQFSSSSNAIKIVTNASQNKNTQENSAQADSVENISLAVPVINKEDIVFSGVDLGKGSFGSVSRATWLESEVAVKTIKLSFNNKYILREIQVMNKIRHPNVISIMAVANDCDSCYIVMKYFNSNSLRKILIDKQIKAAMKLNETKKNDIGQQICKAVTFLHHSNPAIIHKDLKPENILVNMHCITKICDMGLSRIVGMPSNFETTIGENFKGTISYMAPEILIKNERGSLPADVWSLACVIVELYTEHNVWDVAYCRFGYANALSKKIQKQKKPDLSKVPFVLQGVLYACFEHLPEKRARATTLLDMFKLLDTNTD